MALDEGLLSAALEAGARAVDAERGADAAKADYHHAIRRLQLSGATMREIASALNLSHQRVHQIVDAYGGGRRWRRRKTSDTETLVCSFCGAHQPTCKKLIAGPGIYICDRCVQQAAQIVAGHQRKAADAGDLVAVGPREGGQCGFCGKDRSKVKRVVTAANQPPPPTKSKYGIVAICNECLLFCGEIIEQKAR
jgi:ClpX C4-type zinc finger